MIFDPFPSIADPDDANKMILSPATKDYKKVEEILKQMPSIQVHFAKARSREKKREYLYFKS